MNGAMQAIYDSPVVRRLSQLGPDERPWCMPCPICADVGFDPVVWRPELFARSPDAS